MIISITGTPGSGKSTVAKELAKILNLNHYYIGALQRKRAKEKGMTIDEYNRWSEQNKQADLEIEEYIQKLGEKEDNFIIESRTAWHFIPHSIKILLKTDIQEAARRILTDLHEKKVDRNENMYQSLEEAIEGIKKRMESERKRYIDLYNIDPYDEKNFDIILDTTNLSPDEVIEELLKKIRAKTSS